MKKFTLFCILLSLFGVHITAEAQRSTSDANIYGHVTKRGSGEHLPYINIIVRGTTIGTATDASGHYFIKNMPEGEFTVEASALGYDTRFKTVTLRRGETIEVNFEIGEQPLELDGVVVSASRSETSRKMAPALVGVIDPKIFNMTNSVSLAQGLCFQPGLRVEDDCQNCGFMQVRINGLDGHYSQILIDSHPVFSALSGVYGLEQIPASMIERVEVLRGGGSALFGSSAIGGTINVITRDPLRNSAEASHSLTSIGITGALDNVTSANASLVTESRRAGLYVYGQNRNRNGYDHNGDGFTEIPTLQSLSFGLRSFLKTGTYSRLTLQYSGVKEYRRGGDLLERPPHEAFIAEQTDHLINGGSLSFDISSADFRERFNTYVSFQNTARKSYYGAEQDPDAYGRTHDLTVAAGAQYIHSFRRLLFMPADLTLGIEYNHNFLEDESLGYDHHSLQKVDIYSIYAQNEWKNDKWSLLAGCRMDRHSLIDTPIFSPRANIRFNPTPNINLRASYSSGFRAPQAFDEDMHIAIVGGERVAIRLADNLREERSHSLSLSADLYGKFGNVQTNLLVEGFFTTLDDVFVLRETGEFNDAGASVKERTNGSGATVTGLNIEAKAAFASRVELQAGATVQRSRYKEPEQWSNDPQTPPESRMFRTPNLYGYLTSIIKPFKNFDVSLSGTYTGSMLVQHIAGSGTDRDIAVRTPGFFDLNIKLCYDIPIYSEIVMEINCGVQNLFNSYQKDFDTGANRDSGYIYGPSQPRSLFAGIKFRF